MKSFLSACGLASSLQLVIEGGDILDGELRLVHQPFALIGRDPRADVVLDHTQVSRRHVYLQVIESQTFWVDLESRTGSRSDGALQKSGWLDERHPLGIGPFVIRRFADGGGISTDQGQAEIARDSPLVSLAQNDGDLPEVFLEFLNGPAQAMVWPVRRLLSLIGSASGCKYRLTDPSVSRFHASLVRTSEGLWIVDLLGQGGISVNDAPVRFSHLTEGDRLKIGRYQVRVRCGTDPQESGARSPDRTVLQPLVPPGGRVGTGNGVMVPDRGANKPTRSAELWPAGATNLPAAIRTLGSLSPSDVPATGIAFPVPMAPSELTDSMLVPLVNQFGMMQQQMFDQFQNAMAMMVQMFGTMHRDQMAVIREELDRLNELTEEFQALRAELASRTHEQGALLPGEPGAVSAEGSPSAAAQPRHSAMSPGSAKSQNLGRPKADPGAPVPRSSPAPRRPATPPKSKPAPGPSKHPQNSALVPPADPDAASVPSSDSDRDSVVWLHQRILTLQRERESRWQKILKLLPGVS